MKIKVSDYIADFLVQNGILHIFTVTGGGAMHLNDSFGHHSKLKCIYNHHEQACAIAAEAYARIDNKIAAVCVTSGPGGTNAITGVMGAWVDSIPMLIISGQVKRETTVWSTSLPLRQLGDQEFNISEAVKNMTKYAVMVTAENEIAYHLEKALFLAKNGRPGPCWLDIPVDVQSAMVDTDELIHFNENACKENTGDITVETAMEIIDRIKNAKRPVILAGTAIRLADVHNEFIELIERLNIPVVTEWNAHDILWDEHRLYCGRPGTLGSRGGNFVVQNSDLLLSLGSRLNIRMISYTRGEFAKNAYKIVVDIDEAELKKPSITPDMPIHCDIRKVLKTLLQQDCNINNDGHKQWLKWCHDVNKKYPVVLDRHCTSTSSVNPYFFADSLFKQLKGDDTIITGNGSACVVTFQAAAIKKGQRIFTNSGCASMGYGLPAAFGGSVALNGKRVICIEGDGSIQMNLQELQTIIYNKANIKIFILNNNGYHSCRQTQTNLFGLPLVGVCEDNGISFPDMSKLAPAYGYPYFRIDSHEHMQDTITEVLASAGPVICEIIVDETQNFEPKLSSRVLPDGTITSPSIDDMFPFLDRDEYEKNHF